MANGQLKMLRLRNLERIFALNNVSQQQSVHLELELRSESWLSGSSRRPSAFISNPAPEILARWNTLGIVIANVVGVRVHARCGLGRMQHVLWREKCNFIWLNLGQLIMRRFLIYLKV